LYGNSISNAFGKEFRRKLPEIGSLVKVRKWERREN
jgi:hypothetical protein